MVISNPWIKPGVTIIQINLEEVEEDEAIRTALLMLLVKILIDNEDENKFIIFQ